MLAHIYLFIYIYIYIAVTHLLITKFILKWQEYVVSVILISVLNI
jgi:hypothetical protein